MSVRTPRRVEEHRSHAPAEAPRPAGRVRVAAPWQSVWLSFALAMVVFCVFDSGALVDGVRAMPIGPLRSGLLPVVSGLDRTANFFSLNRPADALASMAGHQDTASDFELPVPTTVAASAGTTPTTAPAVVPLRQVTAALPLVVVSAGDSMAQPTGESLAASQSDGEPYAVTYEFKLSSGLSRPDYFNWPARLRTLAAQTKPEALVLTFGGNDTQEITDPFGNVVAVPKSSDWARLYEERLAGLFDLLKADGRRIVWVMPPRMSDPERDRLAGLMRTAATSAASTRPWVLLVDTAALTSGPGGGFAQSIVGSDGTEIQCRASDGVHFAPGCSRLVASAIRRTIDGAWHIGEPDSVVGGSATATTVPVGVTTTP